nr:unnamed protein product [Callosobruchus analis]
MEDYESCIQIKGLHFLPPVITEKRRIELQRYKQQAIKLEKRLRNCRKLKKNLEELMQAKLPPQEKPLMTKTPNLTVDVVSVTEFSNDGIKVWSGNECVYKKGNENPVEQNETKAMNENQGSNETTHDKANSSTETCESSISFDKSSQASYTVFRKSDIAQVDSEPEKQSISTETLSSTSDLTSPGKPRLIRSNSYTLDTPSPILLAHLEKINKGIQSNPPKQNLARTWTSLEDNYIPFERSEFSSMDTVLNTDDLSYSESKSKECHSPQVAVVQTDISVQHISVRGEEGDEKKLMEVLEKIPETYSKQILELIEKHFGNLDSEKDTQQMNKTMTEQQGKENSALIVENARQLHKNMAELHDKEDSALNEDNDASWLHKNITVQDDKEHSAPLIEESCASQMHKNITVRSNTTPTKVERFPYGLKMTSSHIEQNVFDKHKAVIPAMDSCILRRKRLSFSNNDVPSHFNRAMSNIKREWAARIICAHAKGYLTRRLLKTERVQSLIITIKDALMCALQLHSADNINEADVELHRRLINQVSSACYAFHDVFFAFSIPEQMAMIAADRQRKQEKSKRPSSAPTSRSRLSSRSGRQLTLQSRSLTNM